MIIPLGSNVFSTVQKYKGASGVPASRKNFTSNPPRFSGSSSKNQSHINVKTLFTMGLMALGIQGANGFLWKNPSNTQTGLTLNNPVPTPNQPMLGAPPVGPDWFQSSAVTQPEFSQPLPIAASEKPNPAPVMLNSPEEALSLAKAGKIAHQPDAIKLITGPAHENLLYEIQLKNGTTVALNIPEDQSDHQAFLNQLKGKYHFTPKPAPASESAFLTSVMVGVGETLVLSGLVALLRKMAQKTMGNGSPTDSQAKRITNTASDSKKASASDAVGFKDVRGYPEVIRELKRVKERYLSSNLGQGDTKIKVKPIKGILLEGPPGTGKSMMAKALATESKVPFHYVSGSQFVELYVGVGAARVRSLFAQAKKDADKHGGAIIFIDELDSIGGKREHGIGGGNEERTHALNELLQQMSGFNDDPRIMVLAATNRADYLDDALKRSGRFDKTIQVDLPRDKEQRLDILDKYLSEHPVAEKLDKDVMAEFTYGKSGADLANLVNQMAEAAVDRVTEAKEKPEKSGLLEDPEFHKLNTVDFFNAMRNMEMGIPREAQGNEEERKTVAIHEVVGHGLVARAAKTPLHIVSMQPRGNALGHVITDPRVSSRMLPTLESMLKDLVISMGGRASERELLGADKITPGASGDIGQSRAKIRQMLATRMLSRGSGEDYQNPGSTLNEQDRKLADSLLKEAETTATEVIRKVPREKLDQLVQKALNLTEELEGESANAFYNEVLEAIGQDALYEPIQRFVQKNAE
jgi:cell division protease FtsH